MKPATVQLKEGLYDNIIRSRMVFNSVEFIFFFLVIIFRLFFITAQVQVFLLLAASCYFYMAFVSICILMLGFTIVIDYFAGIFIESQIGKKRKLYLVMSLVASIGVLAFFK